ncbi:MAG TPA: hypothetical protein VGN73_04350 [Gemmatimonadaceae bacterium]|nr:hypothetical protein [Gemmatimonadaceae bacterium]
MIYQLKQRTRPLAGLAALTILAACSSDVTGSNMHNVQLSFTTNATVAGSANRVAADLVVGPNDELVLKKVQLVFGRIELDQTGNAGCIPDSEDDDDRAGDNGMAAECEEVKLDPLLVDVPVDDALHPIINVALPAGTFAEMEARLAPARDRFTAFNAANPDLVGKSVRVEGTFNGTAFVFTSAVRAKLEMDFDPALVIDETTKNATVAIDVRNWFLTSGGAVIDPTTAIPGSLGLMQIENNIRRSFHAFEDDEERGEDHHEGHHGNDDGGHD